MNEAPYTIADRQRLLTLMEELKPRFTKDVCAAIVLWSEDGLQLIGWTREGSTIDPYTALAAAAMQAGGEVPDIFPDRAKQ
jgi:hypothetical protein